MSKVQVHPSSSTAPPAWSAMPRRTAVARCTSAPAAHQSALERNPTLHSTPRHPALQCSVRLQTPSPALTAAGGLLLLVVQQWRAHSAQPPVLPAAPAAPVHPSLDATSTFLLAANAAACRCVELSGADCFVNGNNAGDLVLWFTRLLRACRVCGSEHLLPFFLCCCCAEGALHQRTCHTSQCLAVHQLHSAYKDVQCLQHQLRSRLLLVASQQTNH